MRLSGQQRCSTTHSLSHIGMAIFMAFFVTLLIGCSGGTGQTAVESTSGGAGQTAVESTSGEPAVSTETSSDEQTASLTESAESASESEVSAKEQASVTDTSANDASALAESCPKSVVAVSKSIAELWLLSGGTLAGTTEDAMELDGITEDTQVIGTISRPSSEAVLALSPDLVLLTEDIPAQKELKTELMGMGINTMTIEIGSFADYLACMDELTDLTGRKDLFEQNAVAVGDRIEAIKAESAGRVDAAADGGEAVESASDSATGESTGGEKTFLAMRVSATKNKVFKDSYFACEIFRDFGLRNIAEGNSNLDELNLEAIVAADPDYIFVIPQGKEDEAMESYRAQFESNPVWSELSAVKSNRIFMMPKDYFQYKPNAKWDLAYEYVRDLLQES